MGGTGEGNPPIKQSAGYETEVFTITSRAASTGHPPVTATVTNNPRGAVDRKRPGKSAILFFKSTALHSAPTGMLITPSRWL